MARGVRILIGIERGQNSKRVGGQNSEERVGGHWAGQAMREGWMSTDLIEESECSGGSKGEVGISVGGNGEGVWCGQKKM